MSDPHDVARYIFVNDENELRSGWRVLLFFIILVTVATLLSVLGIVLATLFPSIAFVFTIPPGPDYSGSPARLVHLCVSTAMNLLAAVIASIVCASLLERRRFGSVGFKLHRGWSRDFAFGSLLGAASLAIAVGIAASVGARPEAPTKAATTISVSGWVATASRPSTPHRISPRKSGN